MRESHADQWQPSPPEEALRSVVSLQEKLRRGEIGGQALGLIQLVAAQGGSASTGHGPRAHARGSDQNPWERN
ncbi:MAG: hypothetical protein RIE77_07185 [Phycisphaerales bacterium]|jgi:hypothetical protein